MSGKTVAVIGSGPAGLACAQQLTRAGHMVTVYERDDRIGGLLRYGIPEFRMEKRHLDRRLEQMRAEGTRFRTGVAVGTDLDAADLRRRFDALVVAVGATARRELPVPGRELAGIHQAMEYLPLANRACAGDFDGPPPVNADGQHVVIVGGGDTGADCLGTVLRQGAASVIQLDINPPPGDDRAPDQPWPVYPKVYRVSCRTRGGPRGWPGCAARTGRAPASRYRRRMGTCGCSPRPRFASTATRTVISGRCAWSGWSREQRRPRPGTERVIPADLVLLALGFSGPERDSGIMEQLALRLNPRGNFARGTDFGAGQTSLRGRRRRTGTVTDRVGARRGPQRGGCRRPLPDGRHRTSCADRTHRPPARGLRRCHTPLWPALLH